MRGGRTGYGKERRIMPKKKPSFEEALQMVQSLVDKGQPLSMAAKDVVRQTGFKKGELYSSFLK